MSESPNVRIAVFFSHPIQYFTPLWQELSRRPGVTLRVYYFSREGLEHSRDAGFGVSFAWDIDLLAGYDSRFLPRQWPTRDLHDSGLLALNRGLFGALREGWDAVVISGYAHANNWLITGACSMLGIPVLCWADTNPRTERGKPEWKLAAKRAVLSGFLPRIAAILASGGGTREYFESYGVPSHSIFIVPCAVDVDRFRRTVDEASPELVAELRARWKIPSRWRIVMFCGKLARWKRPADVLEAVRRLHRADTLAVFVGDGELREDLERSASSYGVVVGFVNQAEIPIALSFADVLVLSSEYEPYGTVVAEAQAIGVPAIVSDACGCYGPDSVLLAGVSGFVYPTGDIEVLTDCIRRVLDDDALRAELSANARVRGDTQSPVVAADGVLAAAGYARGAQQP
jgi:glycosyltransferase involved in cell wall biosynthesis